MSNKKIITVVIVATIIGLMIIGMAIAVFSFGVFQEKKIETKNINENETKIAFTEKELWGENVKTTTIKTPYMDFSYPKKWKEIFEIEKKIDGVNTEINFFGKEELEGICIFSIFFGNAKEGAVDIGKIHTDGDRSIKASYLVYEDYEGYTEEQIENIQGLQENINEIIIQIYNNEYFTSNK